MRLVTFAEENPNGKLIFGAAVAVVAEYWKTIKGLGGGHCTGWRETTKGRRHVVINGLSNRNPKEASML